MLPMTFLCISSEVYAYILRYFCVHCQLFSRRSSSIGSFRLLARKRRRKLNPDVCISKALDAVELGNQKKGNNRSVAVNVFLVV